VFVAREVMEIPLLIWGDALWRWSPEGYVDPEARPGGGPVAVLTPHSTVRAIAAGYAPGVDASARRAARS
jgi:hypothetical protein